MSFFPKRSASPGTVARFFALVLLVVTLRPDAAAADGVIYQSGLFNKVAINGYDPVAYFTESRPVEGSADHTTEWMGATWRFASAENKERFEADPEAYAPQYGGYCAYAVSQGYTASTDPDAWTVRDGKLYLNYNLQVRETWREDPAGFIAQADTNWPALKADLEE